MGNSASYDSRRGYARPGEFTLPVAEPKPGEPRPRVATIPNHTTPTPPAGHDRINRINSLNTINPASPINRIIAVNRTNTGSTVNRKYVSARFELLPERKPQWNRIGISAAAQLVTLGLLLLAPLIFPQPMQTALKFDVVELMQPITQIQIPSTTPPPPPPKVRPKVPPPQPKPVVPEIVELTPRQPHVFLPTKPELPKVRTLEAKPLELNPILKETKIIVETRQPAPPKEEVKVGSLTSGSPAPVTVTAPLNKVQTGGFGDPNGLPGAGDPNRAANINRAGSPLLPGGPGYGNGSGGARGIRGVAAAEESKQNGLATRGATTGVDILNKPNPVYSTEGRTLRIEGDVVLEVVFLASGQMQVTRVVSSLGHGLDEAAILAAKQIRFRPAKRDGQPVDFPARVRIGFRLAE
jgi:TonB family protein